MYHGPPSPEIRCSSLLRSATRGTNLGVYFAASSRAVSPREAMFIVLESVRAPRRRSSSAKGSARLTIARLRPVP